MTAPRIACAIDLSLPVNQQKPTSQVSPMLRPVQFTEAQVQSPKELTRQLNDLHQEVKQTTQAVRAHPEQAPVTFKNLVCPDSGGKITLTHNFGIFADYIITKWSGSAVTSGPSLVSDEKDGTTALTDENKLVLRSYVAGTANIRVFPGV